MKPTIEEFLQNPKAITLMGMSGVGKTRLSAMLAKHGWHHYSCDYLIGTKYMSDALADDAKNISKKNIRNLSTFIGKVGDPSKGGIELKEYKRRQKLYYDAECQSLRDVAAAMRETPGTDFVNDSTGSLCEILDQDVVAEVGRVTLFVYIKASPQEELKVLDRAQRSPKPMFFPPDRFDEWLADYMENKNIDDPDKIDPDEFSRWIFPRLFEARLPKYQRLADLYGVTIPSEDLRAVHDDRQFIDCVAKTLKDPAVHWHVG
ncbi:MAG TPA: ATPase [Patescibacteria group bacterium]|nr:hypothetical protein [Xanthobacteraceae bacterium]HTK84983.1 ATPase [Patescibacteria group bacterium]